MVKYLLMIYVDEQTRAGLSSEDWTVAMTDQEAFNVKFFATGELLSAFELADIEQAKLVQVRRGDPTVVDGPYLSSNEHLKSYFLLDVDRQERALEIAAQLPFAHIGSVEVWPVLHKVAGDR